VICSLFSRSTRSSSHSLALWHIQRFWREMQAMEMPEYGKHGKHGKP
jgi:hypothetical protein